ncbi:MAG: alkaline phosphatase family protein [Bacteroidetes bacterium]|nr:alkaline phosphatase family protein [Bacteroidota bacterium]
MRRVLFFIFLLIYGLNISAQLPKIIAGPMNGYSEHRECLIWLQTKCAKKVVVFYQCENDDKLKGFVTKNIENGENCEPAISKIVLTDLEPGRTYKYKIFIDNKEVKFEYPLKFQTKELWEWRTAAPNFSFLVGSCNYINDSLYDRPGEPYGQSTSIFQKMAENPAKTMFWLGDNVYLREADYSSESGIKYRYMHTRKQKDLQKLFATKQNYAIWDDHDYGPNNSNQYYNLKNTTTNLFKEYWGNKTYGFEGKGIYSYTQISDCDFFLLDNRTFRDENLLIDSLTSKTQLGQLQLDWLLQGLLASKATFKFILMGGQFLNTNTNEESYNLFANERQTIINFIQTYKISGVIFISGDRHHTEVLKDSPFKLDTANTNATNNPIAVKLDKPKKEKKKDKKGKSNTTTDTEVEEEVITVPKVPSLFEITCSPLTSKGSNVLKTAEANNPQRIKQTLFTDPNYCQISINGQKGNRNILIKCFNASNELKWEFTIRQEELSWSN